MVNFCLLEYQCLGDGGRSRILVNVRVCLKNVMMVLMSFLGFMFFIRFSRLNEHCPKLYCLILEKATQSVRMCVAVSSSSLTSQCAQCGSSASLILYACLFRLLCPVRTFVMIAVSSLFSSFISL